MISKHEIRRLMMSVICLCMIVLAGCKEGADRVSQPEKEMPPAKIISPPALKALPAVVLLGTRVDDNFVESAVRVAITASGTFGYNVIRKADPERIIVVIHNATKGEAPPVIEVNNGTINRVEIAQLVAGKGSAVRITIGLDRNAEYVVTPSDNGLMIDVKTGT